MSNRPVIALAYPLLDSISSTTGNIPRRQEQPPDQRPNTDNSVNRKPQEQQTEQQSKTDDSVNQIVHDVDNIRKRQVQRSEQQSIIRSISIDNPGNQRRQKQHSNQHSNTTSMIIVAIILGAILLLRLYLGIPSKTEKEEEEEKKFCPINVKTLEYNHALIIKPGDHSKFIYPNDDGTIIFLENEHVFLSCPGQNNRLINLLTSPQSMTFKCVRNQDFKADLVDYNFKDLVCESPPQYEVVPLEIYEHERQFKVGFYTDKLRSFLELIYIRYDRSLTSSTWVKSEIPKTIAGGQRTAKNRRFDKTYCCENLSVDLDEAYKTLIQDQSFAQQLNCHMNAVPKCLYLDEKQDIVFNRGHLVPKSTFVYTSAGIATFLYLNTGIQWKQINNGNWARIEEHVIQMTKELKKDLTVYTGVLGRLMLKDIADGNETKLIYLYQENDVKAMPIPLYFWKLVYDPDGNKGIVYVTVNNPYMEDHEAHHICSNAMTKIDGVKTPRQWRPKFIQKGYSYMCQVADFIRYNEILLDNFPAHTVTELLYLPQAINLNTI